LNPAGLKSRISVIFQGKIMLYNTFGSTGIRVSAVGFGGMRFEAKDDRDTCASLVKAAYDAGINYFDTAPGYERSEEIYGIAIKEMQKTRAEKPFYISTKTMKADPGQIRKDLETSLKRLNLDCIDFYHVWCIMSLDAYNNRKAKGVLKEFERLRTEGLIKHICVSTHMTGVDISKMLNDYPFEGVLLGYSAANFAYREEGLVAAAKLNRAAVIMNPLGGGTIPQNPDRFDFTKTRTGETVAEAAIRFLLNDARVTIILIGLGSIAHLREAISAVDGFKPIPQETIKKIRSSLSLAFNELCTSCCYCDNCPQDIPIPKLMDVYNRYVLTGRHMELINHIRYYWSIGLKDELLRRCNACGRCEEACTQKLPIIDRLKIIKSEVEKFLKAEAEKQKNS
jgi:predicted aldo/keto reductase-like oxidoreductase